MVNRPGDDVPTLALAVGASHIVLFVSTLLKAAVRMARRRVDRPAAGGNAREKYMAAEPKHEVGLPWKGHLKRSLLLSYRL